MPEVAGARGPVPSSENRADGDAPRFVHLHLHSEYSLLDGGNRLDKLVKRVKDLGMDAVAVTDHGNLHAAVNFYEIARANGVKPILGVEAYVAPGDRRDRTFTGVQDGGFHLVLLAEDLTGWNNLMELCSEAYLTGFYFKPRMDRALLERLGDGLIAIDGHLGSELAHHLVKHEATGDRAHWQAAVDVCAWKSRVFGPNASGEPRFFIELQHHVPEQNRINPLLVRLARELDLPLVCDNDSHFLLAEDHDAHDTLVCISTGKSKFDEERQKMKYPPGLYVKSPREMADVFASSLYNNESLGNAGLEALANTVRIADRCNVELPIGVSHAPVVIVNAPPEENLPRADDPAYNGDLTAWYQDYCSRITLDPATDPGLDQSTLKDGCDRALRLLAEAGMVWRYGPDILAHRHAKIEGEDGPPRHLSSAGADRAGGPSPAGSEGAALDAWLKWARLNRELKILADKLISAYFLIVWDFVSWGRARGIPALARGSGVGTMVGYVLGLSNACPVRFGLLFERFTDPDRSEYPDIDIDLCQDGRGDVIRYVRQKYGHVAQIITFGTLKARAAIRDVCRVHEIPLADADKLAKLVPEELKITIEKALEQEPDLKAWYDRDEAVKRVIDTARVLEGQARHASVHAAGVIVATRPLHQIVPLYKASGGGEDDIITQWDGPTCEKMGLLKMDFLGLRTLSVIERAKRLIRETLSEEEIYRAVGRVSGGSAPGGSAPGGSALRADTPTADLRNAGSQSRPTQTKGPHPLDLDRLPTNDPNVFALFQRGDTTGVFQFESGGMRRLLLDMKPDRLEDLIAANALFRPGPMDLIPDYNRRKHGQDRVPAVHEIVDRFTANTYGVMVYQEQVMQIVHELGGIPLRGAYTLIKAISKKKASAIDAARPKFVDGAQRQGLSKPQAEELFELILKFAGYGFNKSHSTGYAIVAYHTAYLKTYFPNHYMAAFLSFESQAQKVADWLPYLEDCKKTRFIDPLSGQTVREGVEVRPPDINLSEADFAVVHEPGEPRAAHTGHVRFGLRAIKGVGAKAIEGIVAERRGTAGSAGQQGIEASKQQGIEASRHQGANGGALPMMPAGLNASVPVLASKPFPSLFDFCERVPPGVVNRATIEALVKAGAFDGVHGRAERAAMLATVEQAMAAGQKIAQDKAAGQSQLFGFADPEPAADAPRATTPLVRVTPWSEAETLRQEKETLGFYVSSHPLDEWSAWTRVFTDKTCAHLRTMRQDERVILPALVQSVRVIVVRSGRSAGQKMGIITAEDTTGTAEAVMFSNVYAQFAHLVENAGAAATPVFILGRIDHSRGDPQVIVDKLVPIDGQPLERGKLLVTLREASINGSARRLLPELKRLLDTHAPLSAPSGPVNGHAVPSVVSRKTSAEILAEASAGAPAPYDLLVETDDAWVTLAPPPRSAVTLEPGLIKELTRVLGDGAVHLVGGVSVEINREERKYPKRA